MPDRPEMVLKLTHSLARRPHRDPLPLRLCHAVVDVVEASAGAISLGFGSPDRTLLCATSDDAARFEDAQDLMREGPSLDAFRTASPVVSTTTADQLRRWPALSETLARSAGRTVHALPMKPGAAVIGVMTVHDAHTAGDLTTLIREALQFLADAVGAAIIGDLPTQADPSTLWSERDRISQATGMVVAQLDLEPADALAVLRAHAFAEASSVVEISRKVVARELDFGRQDPGGSA